MMNENYNYKNYIIEVYDGNYKIQ